MIRVLVMIAVAGFLVSVVTLSSALAIGGPDLFTDGVWNLSDRHFGWTFDDDYDSHGHGDGAQATREMVWTGGDSLDIEIPAEVTYTQAPGTGKLTINGPQRVVNDLVIEDGHLRFAHGHRHYSDGDLVIAMTAPSVSRFNIDGSGRLSIDGYRQDKLALDISGDAEVTVKGEAKSLGLDVTGSGASDLSGLKLGDADVSMEGSGQATLAPTGSVNIDISGSGDVNLLTRPMRMESNVSGSGSIHQQDGGPTPPTPPEPPAPPKAPKPPHAKTST
ncbi:GIN domain-containing protein [Phenylobacterium sp.]|jgi:hypothetical protein|uniref:GIN domain-containing protein n=1 Tax=Phenylobacterium sp. TaxID=1871053 RepID=UPI002F3E40D1